MSSRTATVLAIVVATFVVGGTALAITGQFGSDPVVTDSAASPDLDSSFPGFGDLTTTTSPDDLLAVLPTTPSPDSSITTTTAAAPSTTLAPTTTTRAPTTTTTKAPTTTTTKAPTTTTTKAPTTTTTVAPTTTTTAPPAGGSYSAGSESQFVNLINGVRADLGVPPLTVSSSLKSYARDWSHHMASTNTFAHSNIGSLLGPWSTVGENIAYGWSVQSMHDALVASPGHYANLTSENFTHIGVGVWIEDGGKIWTTHVFGG